MPESEKTTLIPSYTIHLNGSRLPPEKESSVIEIVVNERIDSPSSLTITVSDPEGEWADNADVSEGSTVKITMGYKDEIEELMNGEITAFTGIFRENANDTLIIKGSSVLQRLINSKRIRAFNEKTDEDIVKEIASEYGLSVESDDLSTSHLFSLQNNTSDYDLVMSIAKKYGYRVWTQESKLMIKQPEAGGQDVVLEWDKTLKDFTVEFDSKNILTSVEIRGYDKDKAEAITGTATCDDITDKVGGDSIGSANYQSGITDRKYEVGDDDILDASAADALALSIITENSYKYIQATGKCQGNNKVRAGMIVQINGLATRFCGKYLVLSAKHVLSPSAGYTTYFTLCRNATE